MSEYLTGMTCCMCGVKLPDAENVAITKKGEIIAMCDRHYEMAEIFFKKGEKKDGNSGRNNEIHKQGI